MEDYLKSIYRLQERSQRVTTQGVAERLNVAPASVTSMVKRLAERGLLTHERYRGVELTESGKRVAQEMIRHHRLLELYLTRALGFEHDQVHAEAERLEHFISEQLEDRIDQVLGRPTCDPHGSPIPGRPGKAPQEKLTNLQELELFLPALIVTSPAELQHSGMQGGAVVTVLGRPPGAKVHVRVNQSECLIDSDACRLVMVERTDGEN
jgi:DtxR family transcriptional regulator, Mn-dependent transcriptional regulator